VPPNIVLKRGFSNNVSPVEKKYCHENGIKSS
jgi:hypothetical protein